MEAQRSDLPKVQQGPRPRNRKRNLIIASIAASLLALGGAGIWAANISAQEAEQRTVAAAASASAEASAQASTAAAAKKAAEDAAFFASERARMATEKAAQAQEVEQLRSESERKQMEAQGWTFAGNQMYFQYLDNSKFTCGSWKCTYLGVVSMALNGCPGGIYVAVSIDRGKSSIGSTNEITAGLPKGKIAQVKLEDTSNQGDGFQITKMNCLG